MSYPKPVKSKGKHTWTTRVKDKDDGLQQWERDRIARLKAMKEGKL